VIIDDLDIPGGSVLPYEADPVLVVHANAVLSPPVSGQGFQTIPGYTSQIAEGSRGPKKAESLASGSFNIPEFTAAVAFGKCFGFPAAKTPDHTVIVFRFRYHVKRNGTRAGSKLASQDESAPALTGGAGSKRSENVVWSHVKMVSGPIS